MYDVNDRASWPVEKGRLHDPPPKRERPSPAECIAMKRQLADDAWAFMGRSDAETGLQSRIIRVVRRPG
jgi:hypothetical protein